MADNNVQKEQIKEQIRKLLREYYRISEPAFDPSDSRIELSFPSYDADDIAEALDTILKGWPTIGPKVREVEDKIIALTKARNAVMLNSGGSANFLVLYLLSSHHARSGHRLNKGDEIITPAVTWSTTVSPIIQAGCVPVFADVNLGTYDISIEEVEKNITAKTKAVMLIHPMGCACEMDEVVKLCERKSLLLIEDACESIGTKYGDRYAGTFGEFGTFSFYFSHHITSIEGGIIVTDDDDYADILRCMRANGWFREIRNEALKKRFVDENPALDTAFMFPYIGFNMKPTDFAAGLVLRQIDKLEDFIRSRTAVANGLIKALEGYSDYIHLPISPKSCRHSWFTFPIVLKDNAPYSKKELTAFLKERRIDTRPIIAGNITAQPFLKDYTFRSGSLPNSDLVMRSGFFLGVHHKMGPEHVEYVQNAFREFFVSRNSRPARKGAIAP